MTSPTDPIVVALVAAAKSLGRAEWLQQSEVLGPAYAEDVAKYSANLSAVLAAARVIYALCSTEATGRYNLTAYIDAADVLAGALARAEKAR